MSLSDFNGLPILEAGCEQSRTGRRFSGPLAGKSYQTVELLNQETLDGNNGLLLAPHIDYLFDHG